MSKVWVTRSLFIFAAALFSLALFSEAWRSRVRRPRHKPARCTEQVAPPIVKRNIAPPIPRVDPVKEIKRVTRPKRPVRTALSDPCSPPPQRDGRQLLGMKTVSFPQGVLLPKEHCPISMSTLQTVVAIPIYEGDPY
jgi:hypothetical protein